MGVLSAAKKLAIDQFMFAPSFLAVFITVNNLLQGNSIDIIKQQLRFVVLLYTKFIIQIISYHLIKNPNVCH